uniref:Conserved oligomeric Golgi complex subunit 3 n=1 Tax=Panagrolaimus sp. JU765 TaxID=591449 RepID=A0AC34R9E8_9BILA
MEEFTDVIKRGLMDWDNLGLYGMTDVTNPPKPFDFGKDERLILANKLFELENQALECIENEKLIALKNSQTKMENLKHQKGNLDKLLTELDGKYRAVTDKSSSLHHACDQMMSQQTQMASGTEQLKTNLYYYTQWEWIMKRLTTSRLLITGTVIPQIISTIHECMNFLREHPEHRESAAYLEKYEQCLSRTLTAIKAGVLTDIVSCEQEVLARQASNKPIETAVTTGSSFTDDDTFALLYGVFGVKAAGVKNALALVHQYFADNSEYQEMVMECEQEYFRIRENLLKSAVERTVQSLINKHKDSSCTLTRDGCSVLLRLCDDEFRLYKQFFIVEGIQPTGLNSVSPGSIARTSSLTSASQLFWSKTPQSFTEFVEGMCRILYDQLRPLIIHNPHLETLAQLCTLLKVEMIEERCGALVSMMHDETEEFINPREGFVHVMNELVGDVVERIVYRTSSFGQNDILGYNPAPGDLAYPERLLMMKNIEAETSSTPKTSMDSGRKQSSTSAIDLHCLWYPTVRRTIVCLSKLYKCLDQTVFVSISRELLDQCCQSLEDAAEKMKSLPIDPSKASVKGFGRQLDAELFVVKHLLIIREQTSPYRITAKALKSSTVGTSTDSAMSHFDYSIDLSKYRNQAMQLFTPESRSKWFELSTNNAFLSFLLSSPVQIHELEIDSRRIIEERLKRHCHKLIKFVTEMVTSGLNPITNEMNIVENSPDKELWKKNPKLQPKTLNDSVSEVLKNLKQNWPMIRSAFTLYIGVRETEEILLQPIRNAIREVFKNVNLFVQTYFSEEQKQVASVPDSAQIWVLLNA